MQGDRTSVPNDADYTTIDRYLRQVTSTPRYSVVLPSFLVNLYLLICVYTDVGIVDNGEASLWAHHGVVKTAVDELADYFVGRDPLKYRKFKAHPPV